MSYVTLLASLVSLERDDEARTRLDQLKARYSKVTRVTVLEQRADGIRHADDTDL